MSAAPLRRRAPARRPPARRPAAAPRRPVPGARVVRPAGQAVLDRLLVGRLWIGLVFLLLVGIVFFNVDLLRMNRDIAATAEKAETIKRENARLRGDLARLGSSERIQTAAAQRGLVLPAAGEVRYLRANPGADGRNALARLKAGSGTAAPRPRAAGAGRAGRDRAGPGRDHDHAAGDHTPDDRAADDHHAPDRHSTATGRGRAPGRARGGAVGRAVDPARPQDRPPLRHLPTASGPGRAARRLARHREGGLAVRARRDPAGRGSRGTGRAAARSPTATGSSWPSPRTPPRCSPTRC